METWHFILALLVLAVGGVFAIIRDGSNREDAWDDEQHIARLRSHWDRERDNFNFRGGRRS